MKFYESKYKNITRISNEQVAAFHNIADQLTKIATWEYLCQNVTFFGQSFCMRSTSVNLASGKLSMHVAPWERILGKLDGWLVSDSGLPEIRADWEPHLCAYGIGADFEKGPTQVELYVRDDYLFTPAGSLLARVVLTAKMRDEVT